MSEFQMKHAGRVSSPVAGFTLLEVLVTMFVIALALLGTAGLQAYAMKVTQSGQLRTEAVILGLDLLERIEANNPGAIAGNYAVDPLPTAAPSDCFAVMCTPADLATYDLVQFNTRLGAVLPGGSATVTRAAAGANLWTYTIQVDWTERITRSSTTTTGLGQTESFSYTVNRTIYDRDAVL
jgi:type IV pilus assembly protein PilV